MTQLSDHIQAVRRRRDGSIDFDYYRVRSTAMRNAAKRDTRTLKTLLRSLAIGTLAVIGVALVMSAPGPVIDASCRHCSVRMMPIDVPSATTLIASSPRALRTE